MAQPDQPQPAGSPLPAADSDHERLRRYLPPDLADELIADLLGPQPAPRRQLEVAVHLACARLAIGSYLPQHLGRQLHDERLISPWLRWLEGSLLFADLSGSTALAERLSTLGREGTELVTGCLNQIFALLIQVIHDYGGDLVAFGGDALLVFFGDDRHPRTAARAALALQEAMHGYVQELPGIGSFPMHLHIGVESGRVAFVSAGAPGALHYSVLGDTVNRVAVAEGYAQPGEVVAGPQAWATLAGFASGAELAAGFRRVDSMRAPARPHLPLPEERILDEPPESAIPRLLAELDLIGPYIPAVLLRRILAEPQLPRIEADLRPVSVLFAQVLGLEALAEALPPALAAECAQAYVSAMHALVEQFGGMINKLDVADQGMKLVAIFGAPTAYEDHAERAARAALEMQQRLYGVNEQIAEIVRAQQSPDKGSQIAIKADLATAATGLLRDISLLRQRIGLNLGTAFAGNVGSDARKEYTVMGDAVNVAARVMSKAEWGQVWCSEAAARVIAGRMRCDDRGYLALKGKALPVQLFELAGPRDDAPAAMLDGDDAPLVGRAAELRWLEDQLVAAGAGAGRAVRVIGEAGVGKSRLTAALCEAAARQGLRLIHASCLSYAAGIPYAAWAEWLKSLCGIVAGDPDELRARKLSRQLAALGPGMDEWLPLLGDLVRLDVADNRLTRGLDPQLRQARRFELIEQLLLSAAAGGPVLVLFEDLHWADPISLDLWRRVAGALATSPILLVGVHRPVGLFADEPDGAQLLDLKELSGEQSAELALALAGGAALPEPLVRQLVERSAGNPLFLSELLRTLLDRWAAAEGGPAEHLLADLPDSLNGLLLARIDRLDEQSRGVLRIASVIGQRIPFGVLQSIQSYDQQALLRDLGRLDAANLTELERLEPERVHSFRHALIQEVAYQSMLYARRRELHGRIGDYLERRYAEDLDDYYGLLAHHYRLSDRRDKAAEYLQRAGAAAQAVYANDEAIQYFAWALDALAGDEADPRAWQVRDALADVYATVGRYDEALAQHAAILAAPAATPDARCRALRKRGSVLEKQGQYAAALEALEQAMALVRAGEPGISPLALSQISADIGMVRQRLGDYDQAIAACEAGLRAIQDDPSSFDDEKIEARLHSTLGAIYGMRGAYARAHEHFEHSLQLRAAVDDLPGMVVSHNNLGYLWQLQSEYARAIEHYQVADELARKINMRLAIVFAAGNAAYALTSLAQYAEAEARCAEVLAIAKSINAQHTIAQSYDMLGLIAYYRGEYDQALALYQQALQIHRTLGGVHQEGSTLANIALVKNAQSDYAAAQDLASQALERALALQSQRLQAEALNVLAEAALGCGDLVNVGARAREALAICEAIGSKHDGAIARRLLGLAALSAGQEYGQQLAASEALFKAISDRFELARTWAAFGSALVASGQSDGWSYLKRAQDTFISIGAHGELQRLSQIAERSR